MPPTTGDYSMIVVELSYSVWSLALIIHGLGTTLDGWQPHMVLACPHVTLPCDYSSGQQGTSDKEAEPEVAVYLHGPSN